MTDEKITYEDVEEYEALFKMVPAFLLGTFAKRNTNIVSKFESQIQDFLRNLNDDQKRKLSIVLSTDIEELQAIMCEAYEKTNLKQYKILADSKYREFIESNLCEIRKLVDELIGSGAD